MDPLVEWFFGHAAWDVGTEVARRALRLTTPRRPVAGWEAHINARLAGEVRIEGVAAAAPVIHVEGPHLLSPSERSAAALERKRLKAESRPNDAHAIVCTEPRWRLNPVNFHVRTLDYAGVRVLRAAGQKPRILSASAVIVCPKARLLLLHMRGASVETYPSCLHTLGGAYIPAGFAGVDADRKGLRATVVREVHEEAQLALAGEATPPMMFSQELSTGFVQLVFLGFSAEAGALEQVLGNWEGDPQLIPYDQLPAILLDEPNWVPSGRAHVLAWLALGAPNAGARPRFATMSPRQLFSAAVSASA